MPYVNVDVDIDIDEILKDLTDDEIIDELLNEYKRLKRKNESYRLHNRRKR